MFKTRRYLASVLAIVLTLSAYTPLVSATTPANEVPFPSPDSPTTVLVEELSNMTAEQLNDYIHSLYLLSTTQNEPLSENATNGGVIQAAWFAAAQIAKTVGYPCAGTIVEYSSAGNDYIESNGLLANTIKTTNAFSSWLKTSGAYIVFEKSDCADLFYAIHKANINLTASPSMARARITDTFDFQFETDMEDLFSTLVNDWAWLSQNINALSAIKIQVDITL